MRRQHVRAALKRMSVYDVETETELARPARVRGRQRECSRMLGKPEEALRADPRCGGGAVREARSGTILLGGNNGVTRPGVHGVDASLKNVGVMTLDAHFDLRDTDGGLNNGNPIQALLQDGLPGRHISQIGIAPFANTKKAHNKAKAAGISVRTLERMFRAWVCPSVVREELARLSKLCTHIYVDFDIDVIDRAQMPAAPGARAGGIAVRDFFAAARTISRRIRSVKCVDLTELDPSMDVNAIGALTGARWAARKF